MMTITWFDSVSMLLRNICLILATLFVVARLIAQGIYLWKEGKRMPVVGLLIPCALLLSGYWWAQMIR